MTPMFQNFDPTSLGSWGSAGLDVLDLPGALARGLLAGRPGERVSGEELLRGWGDQDPGAFASTLTSMATDPLSYLALGGPALRLLRGGAEAAEGVNAARTATPFLKSAAFGFGAPLAGAAVMDANKDYQNPMANALATGLMVSPLAIHAPGMLAGAGRRLAGLAGFGGAAGAAEAAEGVGAAGAAGAGSAGAIPPMAAADFATQHGIPGRAPMLPGGEGYEGHQANSALNPNFQQAIAGMPQNIEAQRPAPGQPLGPEHFEHNQVFEGLPQHEALGIPQAVDAASNTPAAMQQQHGLSPQDAAQHIAADIHAMENGGYPAPGTPYEHVEQARQIRQMYGIPETVDIYSPQALARMTNALQGEFAHAATMEAPGPSSLQPPAPPLPRIPETGDQFPGGGFMGGNAAFAPSSIAARQMNPMNKNPLTAMLMRAMGGMNPTAMPGGFEAVPGGAGGAGVATGDALDKLIGTVGTPRAPTPAGVPTPATLPQAESLAGNFSSGEPNQAWLSDPSGWDAAIRDYYQAHPEQLPGVNVGHQPALPTAGWSPRSQPLPLEALQELLPTAAAEGPTPPIIPQLEGPKPPMPFGELMHTPTSDLADTKVNVPPSLAAGGVPRKFMDAITRSATLGNKRPALMDRVAQILAEERPEAQSKSTAEANGYGPAMQAKAKIGSPLPVMPGWQGRKNMTDPWPMNSDRIAELENVFTRGRAGNMEDVATDPDSAHAKQLAESINATALGNKLNPTDNVGKRGTGNTRENELLAILVKRNKLSPDSPKYAEKYAELTKKAEDFYREKKLKYAYDIQDEHRISAPVAQLAQDLKGQSPTEGFIQPPSDLRAAIEGRIARKEPAILNTRIPVRQPGESQAAFMYRVAHDFATTPEPEIEMERSQAAAAALGQELHPYFPRMEVTKGGEELSIGQELPENNSWPPGTRNDYVQKTLDLPLDDEALRNALVPGAAPTAEQLAQQSLQEELKLSKLPGMGYRPGVPTPAPRPESIEAPAQGYVGSASKANSRLRKLVTQVHQGNLSPEEMSRLRKTYEAMSPQEREAALPPEAATHLFGYEPKTLDPALLDRLMRATGLTPAMLMMLLAGGGGAGGAAALAHGLLGRQYQQQAA